MDRSVDSSLIRFCTFSTPMELPVMDGWAGCASGGENGHRQAHNHPGAAARINAAAFIAIPPHTDVFSLCVLFYAGMPFGDSGFSIRIVSVL